MKASARAAATVWVATALAASAGWAATPGARPGPGRYAAQLCVATADSAPGCGPAQADLRGDGTAIVRVDDVVYRLKLNSSQVAVVVIHNRVQIDDFTVSYEWAGNTLKFEDRDRHARYEVRFDAPRTRPARL